jgi:NADP-dependent 3-hydroxy acid dehydrogenase YdfG
MATSLKPLRDKAMVITGGSSGIGPVTAEPPVEAGR